MQITIFSRSILCFEGLFPFFFIDIRPGLKLYLLLPNELVESIDLHDVSELLGFEGIQVMVSCRKLDLRGSVLVVEVLETPSQILEVFLEILIVHQPFAALDGNKVFECSDDDRLGVKVLVFFQGVNQAVEGVDALQVKRRFFEVFVVVLALGHILRALDIVPYFLLELANLHRMEPRSPLLEPSHRGQSVEVQRQKLVNSLYTLI